MSAGGTGHVEAVQLAYDPEVTGFDELLDVFWALHDPTSELRQGADAGEQYRCAVFYHSDAQRRAAEEGAARQRERGAEVKTRVRAAGAFEVASEEHQRKSAAPAEPPAAIRPRRPSCTRAARCSRYRDVTPPSSREMRR